MQLSEKQVLCPEFIPVLLGESAHFIGGKRGKASVPTVQRGGVYLVTSNLRCSFLSSCSEDSGHCCNVSASQLIHCMIHMPHTQALLPVSQYYKYSPISYSGEWLITCTLWQVDCWWAPPPCCPCGDSLIFFFYHHAGHLHLHCALTHTHTTPHHTPQKHSKNIERIKNERRKKGEINKEGKKQNGLASRTHTPSSFRRNADAEMTIWGAEMN